MFNIDEDVFTSYICAYSDTFYAFIPWLRLNGIEYELEAVNDYVLIKIYKGKTKKQRKLIYHYLNVEFPKIKDRIRR